MSKILHGDSLEVLKTIESDSVDLLCTDPPYGYSFMGKAWDKALPDIGIFKECLRVLKPGAFAFVMSAPRSDVCSRMAILLEEAGFNIAFTPIYWTYASGFPKAMNIGKMVDKRGGKDWNEQKKVSLYIREMMKANGVATKALNVAFGTVAKANHWVAIDANNFCMPTKPDYLKLKPLLQLDDRFDYLIEREEAEREVLENRKQKVGGNGVYGEYSGEANITTPATDAARALDGSYGGFQPKPAVEVIIVAMKPLSEKTYVDQALKNGKGITWLDDARIPIEQGYKAPVRDKSFHDGQANAWLKIDKSSEAVAGADERGRFPANLIVSEEVLDDHSRFFSLDAWAKTLPFLAVPKASKKEKNEGLDGFDKKYVERDNGYSAKISDTKEPRANTHPTVKPLKLMSYLITLGSRPGDTVLDPFLGSGTTAIAAKQLGRECIGIEREEEYVKIAEARSRVVNPGLI